MRTHPLGRNFERISATYPFPETAQKRPDSRNSHLSEFERQTGARRFVRSSAVQDDFAICGNLGPPCCEFIRHQPNGAGNRSGITERVQAMA